MILFSKVRSICLLFSSLVDRRTLVVVLTLSVRHFRALYFVFFARYLGEKADLGEIWGWKPGDGQRVDRRTFVVVLALSDCYFRASGRTFFCFLFQVDRGTLSLYSRRWCATFLVIRMCFLFRRAGRPHYGWRSGFVCVPLSRALGFIRLAFSSGSPAFAACYSCALAVSLCFLE